MDPRSRAALVNRVSALIGSDRPCPTSWGQLSVSDQLLIAERDPEVAQVLQGKMLPAVEVAVLTGTFANQAPVVQTEAELRQAAVDQWIADHPLMDEAESAAQLNRQIAERQAASEMSRLESIAVANRVLKAQGSAARGW